MHANRTLSSTLALLLLAGSLRAAPPPAPLRLASDQADIVLQLHDPRRLVDTVTGLDLVKQLQGLESIKELLDSTNYRRFYQLLAYFEKELGLERTEILQKLAGGGAVLTSKYGDKPPVLFAVQGSDAALAEKFLRLGIRVIEQELARQEAGVKAAKTTHHGVEVFSLGNDLHAARVESVLLISNRGETLRGGLDRALGKEKKSLANHAGLTEAAKLLPNNPLASLWLNMEPVKKNPEFKAIYETPRDPFVTITFGGWADLLGRTPYVAVGLNVDSGSVALSIRLPRGKDGMGADRDVYCPPQGEPNSRPLLQPAGVLFSSSYHYDMARFWTDRVALFGPERAKDVENFDKTSGAVLSTVGFSKLLTGLGPYQRFVAVHQEKAAYKTQPRAVLPAFALVVELRKPEEFRKGMETVLRAAGLFSTPQFGLKMVEEKVHGCNVIAYRFDEKKGLPDDPDGFRFNFSPCFVQVGNQYVFCSTLELCRDLIGLLRKETKGPDAGSGLTSRSVFSVSGGKQVLKSFEDQVVAATILGQALTPAAAREQAKKLLGLFDALGAFTIEETYAPKEFHLDLRLKFKK